MLYNSKSMFLFTFGDRNNSNFISFFRKSWKIEVNRSSHFQPKINHSQYLDSRKRSTTISLYRSLFTYKVTSKMSSNYRKENHYCVFLSEWMQMQATKRLNASHHRKLLEMTEISPAVNQNKIFGLVHQLLLFENIKSLMKMPY